jgi:zinc/manganese transport system permease protein
MMVAAAGELSPSWDVVTDVRQIFAFPFMVDAFRAGTIVAVMAGLIGWFMVLRGESFAGHTLAVVGFPGASGALWLGLSATYGYFAFCVAAAAVIAWASGGDRAGAAGGGAARSATIGTVQAFALACGFLFVSWYAGNLSGLDALLFGSFLGITDGEVMTLLAVAAGAVAVLAVIGRPLLFVSVDPAVAAARGVPARALSVVFLLLLGLAAAEVSQITGALLVFTLLVIPAATAQAVTARPVASLALTVALGLIVTWAGLAVAFYSPYPIGFWVTTFSFAAYLTARASVRLREQFAGAFGDQIGVSTARTSSKLFPPAADRG